MSYVYVQQCGDTNLYKIGVGRDPDARRRNLQTGNPYPLVEIDRIETDYPSVLERFFHNRLEPQRSRRSGATEFFEVDRSKLEVELREGRRWNATFLPMKAQVVALGNERSEDRVVAPTDVLAELAQRLRVARAVRYTAAREEERLECEMKLAIGVASGIDGIATWRTRAKSAVNLALLKREQRRVFELYQRVTYDRPFKLL